MADENFDACLAFTLRPDLGGQPAHNTEGDGGGWTAYDVTLATWMGWCAAHSMKRPTIASFQHLTPTDVLPLYRTWFWQAQLCDEWPAGVDLCVFDFGVGCGPGTSIKVLQEAVQVAPDGVIGPMTRAAVAKASPSVLIARLTHKDADFYSHLSGARLFLRGWDRRNEARCEAAYKMATEMVK